MKKDNRFVVPPGALQFTGKEEPVIDDDTKAADQSSDTIPNELILTQIDDTRLELIRAKKKKQSGSPANAQH
jgi:hypothetical protein